MSKQQTLKEAWLIATKNTYTVQCANCGRFCSMCIETNGEVTLDCDHCETTAEIKYLSSKNVNRTHGKFVSKVHNEQSRDLKEEFKEINSLKIHSSEMPTPKNGFDSAKFEASMSRTF